MTKHNLSRVYVTLHFQVVVPEVRSGIHIGTEVDTIEEHCLLAGFLSHH